MQQAKAEEQQQQQQEDARGKTSQVWLKQAWRGYPDSMKGASHQVGFLALRACILVPALECMAR